MTRHYIVLWGAGATYWSAKDRTLYSGMASVFPDLHAAKTAVEFAVKFWNQRRFLSRGVRRTRPQEFTLVPVRFES